MMPRKFQWLPFLGLLATSAAVLVSVVSLYANRPASSASHVLLGDLEQKPNVDAVPLIPDLRERASAANGVMPLFVTPEQQNEEAAIVKSQVDAARQWLQDPQMSERISGADQLAAYQTKESQELLLEAALHDGETDVRLAALRSLAQFRQLGEPSVSALLPLLEDRYEEVQFEALQVIQIFLNRHDIETKSAKKTLAALKKLVRSKKMSAPVKEALIVLIKDQRV